MSKMKLQRNYAFIDGSYNPEKKIYGCGGFLIDQKGKKHIIQDCDNDPQLAKMRNVAGEILGAKKVIQLALNLGMKVLTIYYDYDGVANWPLKKWKCHKPATMEYAAFAQVAMEMGLQLYFHHVKGHTGILENEEADRLAKEAVGIIVGGKKK